LFEQSAEPANPEQMQGNREKSAEYMQLLRNNPRYERFLKP